MELKKFRDLVDKATAPAELVPLITDEMLEVSGFNLHAKFEGFTAGTKTVNGTRYEIRVSRENQSIGGTYTTGAIRKDDDWKQRTELSMRQMLQGNNPLPPLVRVAHTQDAHWRELVSII